MKVLFDTNVLYSAFTSKGFCEEVVDAAVGDCSIIWSSPLRAELESLLKRRYQIRLATQTALAAFAALCEFVQPEPLPAHVCRDPDDDAVLEAALSGKADFIVTGDDDLLVLGSYRRIRILTPRQFLEHLDATA